MSTPLPCPACGAAMAPEGFGSAFVEVCAGCRGLWFDAGELGRLDSSKKGIGPRLEAALREPLEIPEHATSRSCPRCAVELDPETYELQPEADVDVCPECGGVFLDPGELAQIRRRPLTAEERRAARSRRRRRRERAKRAAEREERAMFVAILVGILASG